MLHRTVVHFPFPSIWRDMLLFAGYKSLRRLRYLEILDLSVNAFNNSIFPFINAATSLITLLLPLNNMEGLFPAKGMLLFPFVSNTVYFFDDVSFAEINV